MRKNYRVLKASSRGRVQRGRAFQVERFHMYGKDFIFIARRRNGKMVYHFPLSDPYAKV